MSGGRGLEEEDERRTQDIALCRAHQNSSIFSNASLGMRTMLWLPSNSSEVSFSGPGRIYRNSVPSSYRSFLPSCWIEIFSHQLDEITAFEWVDMAANLAQLFGILRAYAKEVLRNIWKVPVAHRWGGLPEI